MSSNAERSVIGGLTRSLETIRHCNRWQSARLFKDIVQEAVDIIDSSHCNGDLEAFSQFLKAIYLHEYDDVLKHFMEEDH